MYFISRGKIGIGFSRLRYDGVSPHKIVKYYSKGQMFADHYVFNKQRCKFVYVVV